MEVYLQHLKSLREHMNDHEDKIAFLSAEQSEQQTHIRHLQEDLESIHSEFNRTNVEVETSERESGQISKRIITCQKALATLDADSHTLCQAWDLLNGDLTKQSSRLIEKKLYYKQLQADARSQLDQYQAYYETRPFKQISEELDATIEKAAESAPAVEEEGDDEMITNDPQILEATDDGDGPKLADAESRLRQLQEESQLTAEQLKRVAADSAQLETEGGAFEEDLAALKDENLGEEQFMRSLYDRLEQLQDFSQEVVCASCRHVYVIQCKDSKFVVREAGGEN